MDFFARSIPEPNTGCWLWLGAVRRDGYVRLGSAYMHRASYEAVHGPIPAGLEIDHLCRVRCCVNPDHLEAVTPLENNRRAMKARNLLPTATHCAHGHEFAIVGARPRHGQSQPRCMECARISRRKYDRAKFGWKRSA